MIPLGDILFMFKVKYVDSIMMLVRLDLNLIVSLFQHKCEVSETVSTVVNLPFTKVCWQHILIILLNFFRQGFALHVVSTASEWAMAISFLFFFFTFIREFQKIELAAEVKRSVRLLIIDPLA